MFSIVFPKTELFISLKNYFSKSVVPAALRSVFKSIYGFIQVLSLKEINLYGFSLISIQERDPIQEIVLSFGNEQHISPYLLS